MFVLRGVARPWMHLFGKTAADPTCTNPHILTAVSGYSHALPLWINASPSVRASLVAALRERFCPLKMPPDASNWSPGFDMMMSALEGVKRYAMTVVHVPPRFVVGENACAALCSCPASATSPSTLTLAPALVACGWR